MPPKRTIRAFLDDSGHKEYGVNTSRHFVYAAVLVDSADESGVNADIADLKRHYFRTPNVELKSSWLRFPRDKKRRYMDPFGLTETALTRFIEDLYGWMTAAPITLAAAIIDKPQMKKQYGEDAYYPSAYAYQVFLQRFEMHLSSLCHPSKDHDRAGCGVVGTAMMDLMDGASPAMNQWKTLLQRQHEKLKKNGCHLMKIRFDHVATYLRFGLGHIPPDPDRGPGGLQRVPPVPRSRGRLGCDERVVAGLPLPRQTAAEVHEQRRPLGRIRDSEMPESERAEGPAMARRRRRVRNGRGRGARLHVASCIGRLKRSPKLSGPGGNPPLTPTLPFQIIIGRLSR